MRKTLFAFAFLLLCTTATKAQFYKSFLTSPAFTDSLQKIVTAFSDNYYSIQGNVINTQEDADTYQSVINVPGAKNSLIYRFHSERDTTASWQGMMYKGEDFKEAAKIYKNTFRYINKAHLNTGGFTISFAGNMEEPNESLRFTASVLKAVSGNNDYKKFVAEVEMVNSFTGWEVHLNLHSKKDDMDKY